MTKLSPMSGRKLVKILNKLGYREVRQRGSHIRLVCAGKRSVTVPDYPSIDKTLIRKILRDVELSVEEFDNLKGK
jgi:predicted RNA binding protein YcfA (HicA-like mRNA interferase family)